MCFHHLLVDEFQDTNRLRMQWLRLLAGQHNAIFAVGDDDQSIYAFRGASAANMQDLQKDFAIEKVIKLEQNYPLFVIYLDAANALIDYNRKALGQESWTAQSKGEPLRVFEATSSFVAVYLDQESEDAAKRDRGRSFRYHGAVSARTLESRVLRHAASAPALLIASMADSGFERQESTRSLSRLFGGTTRRRRAARVIISRRAVSALVRSTVTGSRAQQQREPGRPKPKVEGGKTLDESNSSERLPFTLYSSLFTS